MRFLRLSADQVCSLLSEVDAGAPLQLLTKKYGVSSTSIWNWRHYRGLSADRIRQIRTLELRVQQLSRSVAKSQAQVKAAARVIKQLEPSPKRRSLFAAATQVHSGMCRTRSNAAMGLSLATRPCPKIKDRDDALVKEMRRYLAANPGVGFTTMFQVLLQDRGCTRNHAKELYRKERLQVDHRPKKPPVPPRVRKHHLITGRRDQMWAIDFMTHKLTTGTEFFILNCVDEFTRECVFSVATRRYGAAPTIRAFEEALAVGRVPKAVRSDNGGEFTAAAISTWFHRKRIGRTFNRPGHPEENVIVERFNGTLRREVLNWYDFRRFEDVQPLLDDYRARYNIGRPHNSLGGLSPLQFAYLAASRPQLAGAAQTPGAAIPVARRQMLARQARDVVI